MKLIQNFTRAGLLLICAAISLQPAAPASNSSCNSCPVASVDSHATQALAPAQTGGTCSTGLGSNGSPIPDSKCTPGAFNPTVPSTVFGAKRFRTACLRDCLTDSAKKKTTYQAYHIKQNSSCELDHLVPLEMGGADSLDNIWPQCGQATGGKNYKDIKDRVESYLAIQVLLGKKDLEKARTGIASDWTQFIAEEETFCGANSCDIEQYRK